MSLLKSINERSSKYLSICLHCCRFGSLKPEHDGEAQIELYNNNSKTHAHSIRWKHARNQDENMLGMAKKRWLYHEKLTPENNN